MDFIASYWIDFLGVAWLVACWSGYARFYRLRARRGACIASVLQGLRKEWMLAMITRDNRISDASLLTNLERNVSFLASTSIFVIAGLITTLASIDSVHQLLSEMPFFGGNLTAQQLQYKLMLLILIHVYAFFTFTWALRQYGFCAVMVGAAPLAQSEDAMSERERNYALHLAKVIDQAGHAYNDGLRAYYFSIAVLASVISIWVFMLAVAGVVGILYSREFHSKTMRAMLEAGKLHQ